MQYRALKTISSRTYTSKTVWECLEKLRILLVWNIVQLIWVSENNKKIDKFVKRRLEKIPKADGILKLPKSSFIKVNCPFRLQMALE